MALIATLYALAAYLVFLVVTAFTVGFVGNLPAWPKTLDSGGAGPVADAVAVDLALIGLFAVQHSVMARQGFKRRWTRWVPPAMERASYVLASSLLLALLVWQWRPLATPLLWSVQEPVARLALQGLFWGAWVLVLLSTWLIDHFELFGLRQPWAALRGRVVEAQPFRTPLLYRHVRHPLYLGFLLAFWATPDMTAGHALFAAGWTAYILVGVGLEERDLVAAFGPRYRAYQRQVGMLLPRFGRRRPD